MSLWRAMAGKIFANAGKMFTSSAMRKNLRPLHHLSHHGETEEDFHNRYVCYFSRDDIDGWDIRQAMNDLCGMDMVPEPEIIIAAMHACRKVNDYALAIRFLEAVKDKCGSHVATIYPYILQEIGPTLCNLGIETVEELGYDQPELYLKSVFDM